jgi:enoyl-CoA hydratase
MSVATRLEVDGAVAVLTLARPETRNVMDATMVAEIGSAFDEAERREDIHAVVVTGEGPAFCAGADLGLLSSGSAAEYRSTYEGFLRVARSPLPTVAAVNGPAVGAGMNLALSCDVRLVGESGRLIARFPTLGLHPGGGHAWLVQRAAGPELANAMLLFGLELRGHEAVDAGLALRCVSDDELVGAAVSLAQQAAAVPRPLAHRLKETLRHHLAVRSHDEAVAVELDAQRWSRDQPFFAEGIERFRSGQERGRR